MKKEMPLIVALRLYNTNPHVWTVPKKGTLQHETLLEHMGQHEKVKKIRESRYEKLFGEILKK